jgi:hypothetical protein
VTRNPRSLSRNSRIAANLHVEDIVGFLAKGAIPAVCPAQDLPNGRKSLAPHYPENAMQGVRLETQAPDRRNFAQRFFRRIMP